MISWLLPALALAATSERDCDRGIAAACGNLGVAAVAKSPPDWERAFHFYELACELKDGPRCTRAGIFALNGRGTLASPPKAAVLFTKGCEAKHAPSCTNLYVLSQGRTIGLDGSYHRLNGKVPKISAEALKKTLPVQEEACEKKEATACYSLGTFYEGGDPVKKDDKAALRYHSLACDFGEGRGCVHAARFETKKARQKEFLRRACDLQQADACEAF
jgi:TPR repeat protein